MEELWKEIHLPSIQENDKLEGLQEKNGIFRRFFNSHPFEVLSSVTTSSSCTPHSSSSPCFSVTNNTRRLFEDGHQSIMEMGGGGGGSGGDGDDGAGGSESAVERRYKRKIKNRDSAARSRARRQAYTSQLEREHRDLKEENAKLRKQQEKLLVCTPALIPQKRNHTRSLTAPF